VAEVFWQKAPFFSTGRGNPAGGQIYENSYGIRLPFPGADSSFPTRFAGMVVLDNFAAPNYPSQQT